MPSTSPGRGARVVWLTEKPKRSGKSAISRVISVPLPTPDGPHTTIGFGASGFACNIGHPHRLVQIGSNWFKLVGVVRNGSDWFKLVQNGFSTIGSHWFVTFGTASRWFGAGRRGSDGVGLDNPTFEILANPDRCVWVESTGC
eukprot:211819-Prorocentrum_minimum.AAC.1